MTSVSTFIVVIITAIQRIIMTMSLAFCIVTSRKLKVPVTQQSVDEHGSGVESSHSSVADAFRRRQAKPIPHHLIILLSCDRAFQVQGIGMLGSIIQIRSASGGPRCSALRAPRIGGDRSSADCSDLHLGQDRTIESDRGFEQKKLLFPLTTRILEFAAKSEASLSLPGPRLLMWGQASHFKGSCCEHQAKPKKPWQESSEPAEH